MFDIKTYKIFITLLFSFLRAFVVGNGMGVVLFMLSIWTSIISDVRWMPVWVAKGMPNGMLTDVANSLFVWVFFYLSIMIIFKKEEWVDRFYEFSKRFTLTVPFGAIALVYSFLHWPEGSILEIIFSGMMIASSLFLFFILTPIVLIETIWLGVLVNKTKHYGWFKSQCYSFAMLLLLPLLVTRLANLLFVTIFMPKH